MTGPTMSNNPIRLSFMGTASHGSAPLGEPSARAEAEKKRRKSPVFDRARSFIFGSGESGLDR
jgi:hypothetical protein